MNLNRVQLHVVEVLLKTTQHQWVPVASEDTPQRGTEGPACQHSDACMEYTRSAGLWVSLSMPVADSCAPLLGPPGPCALISKDLTGQSRTIAFLKDS